MFENVDGGRTDARVTGIPIAHPGELIKHSCIRLKKCLLYWSFEIYFSKLDVRFH